MDGAEVGLDLFDGRPQLLGIADVAFERLGAAAAGGDLAGNLIAGAGAPHEQRDDRSPIGQRD